MARAYRGDTEAELDRLFLTGLLQQAPDLTGTEAAHLLNERRGEMARKAGIAKGKSGKELDEIVEAAKLSVQSVNRDIRIVRGRAQQAAAAAMGVRLDDQIAAVWAELEASHLRDEAIMHDLERSRSPASIRTRGHQTGKTKIVDGKEVNEVKPTEIVRWRQEEGAVQVQLYGRLQAEVKLRMELRAEHRMLWLGRQFVPDAASAEADQTLAQAVLDMNGDPSVARETALLLLRRELRSLAASGETPLAGDMIRLEQSRIATTINRVKGLREYMRLADGEAGNNGHRSFEVFFQEVAPRAAGAPSTLPALPDPAAGGG
jgi:hypothetical protein